MSFLRNLGKLLMFAGLSMLVYDVVYQWMIEAQFKIRSLREWISDIDTALYIDVQQRAFKVMSSHLWEKIFVEYYAGAVIFVMGLVIYLVYRIIFLAQGGKTAGGYLYKSRD
jgi:hypothetical protein